MESARNGFFLPNLLTFTNGNTFLGSFRGLRFRVKPGTEGEGDEAHEVLACLCWYGEYCLEESEVAAEASFPLTAEGREEVIAWLLAQQEKVPAPEGDAEEPAL